MDAKFKIVMKKDAKVLEDFILFTYRANEPGRNLIMAIPAIGLMVIGYGQGQDKLLQGIVIMLLGCVWLAMVLLRHKIALRGLKKADEGYKEQVELTYMFMGSSIYLSKNGGAEENLGSYSKISCFYEDEYNFYVGMNNEDLYLLPKRSFVQGNVEQFVEYLENKTGEKCEFLPKKIKNKWIMYKIKAKKREEVYDKRVKEKREQSKKR